MKLMNRLTRKLVSKDDLPLLELIGVCFFWVAFLFELVYLVFAKSDFYLPHEEYWHYALTTCYCVKIACTKHSKREWIIIAVLLSIGAIAFVYCGTVVYFRVAAFVVASKDINRDSAIELVGMSLLCMSLLLMARCFCGIQGTMADTFDYGRGIVETRYRLGFSHANQLHYFFFCIIACYLWSKRNSFRVMNGIVIILVNTFFLSLTHSRTGAILCYLLVIGYFVMCYCKKLQNQKWIYSIGYCVILAICILAVVSVRMDVDGHWLLEKLNDVLTGRVFLAHYLRKEQFGLFLNQHVGGTDMGLVILAYSDGLMMAILFVLAIVGLIRQSQQKSDGVQYVLILAILGYIITENQQASAEWVSRSFVWLLLIGQWNTMFIGERHVRESKEELA